jgi:D-alanine-D-alanine ligase
VSLSAGRRLFAGGDAEVQPLDVVFPVMHGSHGEDGTLQGLCEMGDIAYCGPDVASSAVCMDKAFAKVLWRAAGLPVLDDVTVSRSRWQSGSDRVAEDVRTRFGYPVFVKPLSLGSSIGVSRVESDQVLERAMEVAYAYQDRVIVEPAQDDIIEINCSVLGDPDSARASVCEQPVTAGVLSYEDKYMSGGKGDRKGGPKGAGASGAKGDGVPKGGMRSARRIIPAPIDDGLRDTIQQAAVRACASLGVSGVARVDFLVRPEHNAFLVNEINPIPGSLSFYLWEPMGVTFTQLCSEVIDLALRRHAVKRASTYSIDSWLLKR